MNEVIFYGMMVMLICFGVATFFLSRIPSEIFDDEYDVGLDPLLPVFGSMLLGAIGVLFFFNEQADAINDYGYWDFILPFILGGLIYFCYMLNIGMITNIVIFASALLMSFIQPDDFYLELGELSVWQERIVIAIVIFIITKGLSLLNGLGGVGALQVLAVLIVGTIMAYFGALPILLGYVALAYCGAIGAFLSFSFPPEKLVITNGGWGAIGFVLASFMLYGCTEQAEVSMIIACSYLFTEVGIALYNRVILNKKRELGYMYTYYWEIANEDEYDKPVVIGVMKIFFIDMLLALFQLVAYERIALLVFAFAINLWMLQVLKGEAEPLRFFSITRWSANKVKGIFRGDEEQSFEVVDEKKTEEVEVEDIPYKKVKKSPKKNSKTSTKEKSKKTSKLSKKNEKTK